MKTFASCYCETDAEIAERRARELGWTEVEIKHVLNVDVHLVKGTPPLRT